MSIRVMTSIWEHSAARDGALLVMLAIGDFADDTGKAFPSIQTLAKKARLSDRQVQRVLVELVEMGELQIERNAGPKGCNVFRVTNCRGDKLSGVTLATGGGDICSNANIHLKTSESLVAQGKSSGGDKLSGVTPMSPEPSIEPSIEPSEKPSVALANGKAKFLDSAIEVLGYLNQMAGSHYRPVKSNLDKIASRLHEGATVEDCKRVVAAKCRAWKTDPKMSGYLRPETLFGESKFWQYEGESKQASPERKFVP